MKKLISKIDGNAVIIVLIVLAVSSVVYCLMIPVLYN